MKILLFNFNIPDDEASATDQFIACSESTELLVQRAKELGNIMLEGFTDPIPILRPGEEPLETYETYYKIIEQEPLT